MHTSRGSWPSPDEVAARQEELLGPPAGTPEATRQFYGRASSVADELDLDDPLDDPERMREQLANRTPEAIDLGKRARQ